MSALRLVSRYSIVHSLRSHWRLLRHSWGWFWKLQRVCTVWWLPRGPTNLGEKSRSLMKVLWGRWNKSQAWSGPGIMLADKKVLYTRVVWLNNPWLKSTQLTYNIDFGWDCLAVSHCKTSVQYQRLALGSSHMSAYLVLQPFLLAGDGSVSGFSPKVIGG